MTLFFLPSFAGAEVQARKSFPSQPATAFMTRRPADDSSLKREESPPITCTKRSIERPERFRDKLDIPSRCILDSKVVLGNPSCAAAPFGPPSTQLVARSAAVI